MLVKDDKQFKILLDAIEIIFELAESIKFNRIDGDLGKSIDFRYLIDTTALYLYGEPHLHAEVLSPQLAGGGALSTDAAAKAEAPDLVDHLGWLDVKGLAALGQANALVTAEYIFSGSLIGTDRRILISPEHWPEAQGYATKIDAAMKYILSVKDGTVGAAAENSITNIKQSLISLHAVYKERAIAHEELLRETRKIVIKGLSVAGDGSALIAHHRLDRLLKQNLLVNASTDDGFTSDIIAPPPDLIRSWHRRIAREKSPTADRMRLEADAAVLAQVELLNQDWKQGGRVYLFLTDDPGIHRSYRLWLDDEFASGRYPFPALRRTRQYVPILNISSMPGAYVDSGIFEQLQELVEGFISIFESPRVRYSTEHRNEQAYYALGRSARDVREDLEHQYIRHSHSKDPKGQKKFVGLVAEVSDRIEKIGAVWTHAMSLAVTAKADVVRDTALSEDAFWRAFLDDLRIGAQLNKRIVSVAERFEAPIDASVLLRRDYWAISAAQEGRSGDIDHGRRNVASEYLGFEAVGPPRSIRDMIDSLVDEGAGALTTLERMNRSERRLVMGALCLQIGAWAGAETLLRQAEDEIRRAQKLAIKNGGGFGLAPLEREIRFFLCVARRVNADARNWDSEYKALEAELSKLTRLAPDNGYVEQARIEAERLALWVSRLAWTPSKEASIRVARLALSALEAAWDEHFERLLRRPAEGVQWELIQSQVTLNALVLAFWWRNLFGSVEERLAEKARICLAHADEQNLETAHHRLHLGLYRDLARFALSHDPVIQARLADDLIRQIDEVIQRDEDSGYAFDLASVDKIECHNIKTILSRSSGA